jgi:hypothetical protein
MTAEMVFRMDGIILCLFIFQILCFRTVAGYCKIDILDVSRDFSLSGVLPITKSNERAIVPTIPVAADLFWFERGKRYCWVGLIRSPLPENLTHIYLLKLTSKGRNHVESTTYMMCQLF